MSAAERQKRYASTHRDYMLAKSRKHDLWRFHKITIEQYNDMFTKQEGCCAICSRHESEFKRRLAVDHNHSTGVIRGLLCCLCNTNLAVLENKDFCTKASLYLSEVK